MSELAPLDPAHLVTVLARHGVEYVLIGALAARLQGFPRLTADADLTPSRTPENLVRLSAVLPELGARVLTEGVPEGLAFDCSAPVLAHAEIWHLVTDAGRVDLVFRPSGSEGYEDLRESAVQFEVFGVRLAVASLRDITSLRDIVRTKEAAGRPQHRQDVALLREMLRRHPGLG